MEVEETRNKGHFDEDERLVRGKDVISDKWVSCFHSLLNAKTEKLDPGITQSYQNRLPSQI